MSVVFRLNEHPNAVRFLIAKSRSVRGAFVERPDERHAHKVDAHEVDAHEMGACGGLGEMDAHGMGAYHRPPRVTACAADGTARRERWRPLGGQIERAKSGVDSR